MDTKTIESFRNLRTPFYYYDMNLLDTTLRAASAAAARHGYELHYALKANPNPRVVRAVAARGIGADCVSGNEIRRAIRCGVPPRQIVYAGVGKTDREIALALREDILCFNCESLPELRVIGSVARRTGRVARVALRVNPNVDAHTHRYITTGTEENKFGFPVADLPEAIAACRETPNVRLVGLHFHVGSQITDLAPFRDLCDRVNELQQSLGTTTLPYVNVGGGLGIDYRDPDTHPLPDFEAYFDTFATRLRLHPGQRLHFELGRSLVGQCGTLVARALYVKEGAAKNFAIIDAGMNDLLRPALYQTVHPIENLTSAEPPRPYDVVGPVCESADRFAADVLLPAVRRGDLIAIRACGAYGESMASRYNLRPLVRARFSDDPPRHASEAARQ